MKQNDWINAINRHRDIHTQQAHHHVNSPCQLTHSRKTLLGRTGHQARPRRSPSPRLAEDGTARYRTNGDVPSPGGRYPLCWRRPSPTAGHNPPWEHVAPRADCWTTEPGAGSRQPSHTNTLAPSEISRTTTELPYLLLCPITATRRCTENYNLNIFTD